MERVSAPKETSRRLVQLDALRGIAAMAVVLFHYTYAHRIYFPDSDAPFIEVSKGNLGVNLFFVISGFVILMTIERSRSLLDFIVSRVSRLYPAYWAAVLLTFSVLVITDVWPEGRRTVRELAVNLTMTHGYVSVPHIDGVYWTLTVELAFYATIAALFVSRLIPFIEHVSLVLLGLTVVYWELLNRGLSSSPSIVAYAVDTVLSVVLAFQLIPYFIAGMMLYRCYHLGPSSLRLAVLGLSVVVTLIQEGPLLSVVHAAIIGVVALAATSRLAFLSAPPLVFLGTISYTLYLIHNNIGAVIIHGLEQSGFNINWAIVIAVATSMAIASFISHFIEMPALRWTRARYKQWKQTARGQALALRTSRAMKS